MKKILLVIIVITLSYSNILNAESNRCISGDCKNGEGTYIYGSASKYVGTFKNNKPDGKGTFTRNGGNEYVGYWKDGKMDGQGTFKYGNGNVYDGSL